MDSLSTERDALARIRTIKPEFFVNEQVGRLPFEYRLLFVGLWTQADREGRLEDRPRRLKAMLFPYDDVDVEQGLNVLHREQLIVRYEADGLRLIAMPTWHKHQLVNRKETPSKLPALPHSTGQAQGEDSAKPVLEQVEDSAKPVLEQVRHMTRPVLEQVEHMMEGKGREGKGREQEGNGRERTHTVLRRAPLITTEHRSHAHCGRVCLPAFLFSEFVRRRNHLGADAEIRAWAMDVDRQWTGEGPRANDEPGDALSFWRARYDERWPSATVTTHGVSKRTAGNVAAAKRWLERQKSAQEGA